MINISDICDAVGLQWRTSKEDAEYRLRCLREAGFEPDNYSVNYELTEETKKKLGIK